MGELITTNETAAILGVSVARVRQLITQKVLSSEKRGRDHLLEKDAVERYNKQERRSGGRPKKEK